MNNSIKVIKKSNRLMVQANQKIITFFSIALVRTLISRLALFMLTTFIPEIASAADSQPISFTPPPSDVSIVYLTDIFGTVNGVLYGGSSQIMGSMFGMFNAAVLSLGGIVILYTIIVGTINTAGEGQVLGKNWSSIWIPVRTTLGISLLFTYSTGYSVLQVFVMWIVVQGVGAGDLIWNAALDYLDTGGLIVAPLTQSSTTNSSNNNDIIQGAATIMAGTACMSALQTELDSIRNYYLTSSTSPCLSLPTDTSNISSWTPDQQNNYLLCNYAVPDLLNSVDIMAAQTQAQQSYNQTGSPTTVTVKMPNITNSATAGQASYNTLSGACGTITFGLLNAQYNMESTSTSLGLSASEAAQMTDSRAIAVQQVYSDLSLVAETMSDNDTTLNCVGGSFGSCAPGLYYFTSSAYTAAAPFGVPAPTVGNYSQGCVYQTDQSNSCSQWVSPSTQFAPILGGTELQGAVNDYNSIMAPTLNALTNTSTVQSSTAFTYAASSQGWIMAGTYFFSLANANQVSQGSESETDTQSDLQNSTFPPGMTTPTMFCSLSTNPNATTTSASTTSPLCTWFGLGSASNVNSSTALNLAIPYFMEGPTPDNTDSTAIASQPSYSSSWPPMYLTQLNTTVYGYADNASNVVIAGSTVPPAPSFEVDFSPMKFSTQTIGNTNCSPSGIFSISHDICEAIANNFIIPIVNKFINLALSAITITVDIVFGVPLALFAQMFVQAGALLANTTLNPILALISMGNLFVNVCMTVWIIMATATAAVAIDPLGGLPILIFLIIIGPLIISWFAVIWSMGVIACYYVPLLPYIIFTFGSFGWLLGVIEAMVAAPIVALGVSLPEGNHDVFGKGVDAIVLIFGAFLRPGMMIIGYIGGIILSTVAIWLINQGFAQFEAGLYSSAGYTLWTPLFANFFLFGAYFAMCVSIIEKSFELIYKLPDSVLRWIGGSAQGAFGESSAPGDAMQAVKGSVEKGGEALGKGASESRDMSGGDSEKKEEGGTSGKQGSDKGKKPATADLIPPGSTPPA